MGTSSGVSWTLREGNRVLCQKKLGGWSSPRGNCPLPGEAIPHYPSFLKADPRHWWASFFGWKSTPPSWPECWSPWSTWDLPSGPLARSPVCDLAREALGLQQPGDQPGKTNVRPLS
uniref:Uncharacterized protein n=1 Tax=Bos indicus x Bos taurus TaxID=30522 RepID=A0A4W2ELV3_BOBOX